MANVPGARLPAWPARRRARQADRVRALVGHDDLEQQVQIDPAPGPAGAAAGGGGAAGSETGRSTELYKIRACHSARPRSGCPARLLHRPPSPRRRSGGRLGTSARLALLVVGCGAQVGAVDGRQAPPAAGRVDVLAARRSARPRARPATSRSPEYGSWTCSRGPSCDVELLEGGERRRDAEQQLAVGVGPQRRVGGGGDPADAQVVRGGGRSAGGQPGGGGPDGPTDSASTQA